MPHNGLPGYEREERPWGQFERFAHNEPVTVKIVSVDADQAFSLQTHSHRDEFWRVLGGSGRVTVGDETVDAGAGDEFLVKRGEKHRVEGGPDGVQFLEIAFGQFDEHDVVRLEDRYGRT